MVESPQEKLGQFVSLVQFQYSQEILQEWTALRLVDTYVASTPLFNALAVRSADTVLLGELQGALETLKGEGTVAMLLDKWGLPPPPF